MTPDLLLSSVKTAPMRIQPLSYKWACPNFNNKQNLVHGVLRWGRHRGGVLVTTMSDNQFRTLVLLERRLFGLRPQRLLSNNAVFFTYYLIHISAICTSPVLIHAEHSSSAANHMAEWRWSQHTLRLLSPRLHNISTCTQQACFAAEFNKRRSSP